MNVPLYLQIRGELEQQIASGALPSGARLPTETQIRDQYGVSRATAQRVLNDLTEAGLAVRYRRRGTFVSDAVRHQNLLKFVTPQAAAKGAPGRHTVQSARVVQAADATVAMPGVSGDTPLVEMVRLKLDSEDRPTTVERHVSLFSVVPRILEEDLEKLVSFDYLRRLNIPMATTRVYLDPVVLSEQDAELLGSEPGLAAFMRRRQIRDTSGRVIEVTATVVRPGSVQFYVELPVTGGHESDAPSRPEG